MKFLISLSKTTAMLVSCILLKRITNTWILELMILHMFWTVLQHFTDYNPQFSYSDYLLYNTYTLSIEVKYHWKRDLYRNLYVREILYRNLYIREILYVDIWNIYHITHRP